MKNINEIENDKIRNAVKKFNTVKNIKLFLKIIAWLFCLLCIIYLVYNEIQKHIEIENTSEYKVTSPDYGNWLYAKTGTLIEENNCVKFINTITKQNVKMCGTYSIKGI